MQRCQRRRASRVHTDARALRSKDKREAACRDIDRIRSVLPKEFDEPDTLLGLTVTISGRRLRHPEGDYVDLKELFVDSFYDSSLTKDRLSFDEEYETVERFVAVFGGRDHHITFSHMDLPDTRIGSNFACHVDITAIINKQLIRVNLQQLDREDRGTFTYEKVLFQPPRALRDVWPSSINISVRCRGSSDGLPADLGRHEMYKQYKAEPYSMLRVEEVSTVLGIMLASRDGKHKFIGEKAFGAQLLAALQARCGGP